MGVESAQQCVNLHYMYVKGICVGVKLVASQN